MATGGPIESISIRGRRFPVAADASVNRDLGGDSNELQMNGDGTARLIKTKKGWKLENVNVQIDDIRGDQEFLQDVADGSIFVTCVITYVTGVVYQGQGQITGDFMSENIQTIAPVTMEGPGKLTQQ